VSFSEDLSEFFHTDEHATGASFPVTSLNGIWREPFVDAVGVESADYTFQCSEAEAAAIPIAYATVCVKSGGLYYVKELRPSGDGMVTLTLRKAV
jgi:hypothetical protein